LSIGQSLSGAGSSENPAPRRFGHCVTRRSSAAPLTRGRSSVRSSRPTRGRSYHAQSPRSHHRPPSVIAEALRMTTSGDRTVHGSAAASGVSRRSRSRSLRRPVGQPNVRAYYVPSERSLCRIQPTADVQLTGRWPMRGPARGRAADQHRNTGRVDDHMTRAADSLPLPSVEAGRVHPPRGRQRLPLRLGETLRYPDVAAPRSS
jgi:hypothetical protein